MNKKSILMCSVRETILIFWETAKVTSDNFCVPVKIKTGCESFTWDEVVYIPAEAHRSLGSR